jgi:hypothetical protein
MIEFNYKSVVLFCGIGVILIAALAVAASV